MRLARLDAGLSIDGLARLAGLSRKTVQYAEHGTGKSRALTLYKIAKALGRDPEELFPEIAA